MTFKTNDLLEDLIERTRIALNDAEALMQFPIEKLNKKASSESWSALECIEQSEHLNITISELSRITGASTPTLYRGFEEEFGVGPKRFIKIQRLTLVRRELRRGGCRQSIGDVANHWGFWYMGQFAADYRRQFGELPSQTRAGAIYD